MSVTRKNNFNIPRGQNKYERPSVRDLNNQRPVQSTANSRVERSEIPRRVQSTGSSISGNSGNRSIPRHVESSQYSIPRRVERTSSEPHMQNPAPQTCFERPMTEAPSQTGMPAYDGFSYQDESIDSPTSIFDDQKYAQFDQNFRQAEHAAGQDKVNYKPKARKSPVTSIISIIVVIALFFGLAWGLRTYVFCAYEIPSGSMEKTIMTGDMVFAEKLSHNFVSPKRGDIITFDDPNTAGRVLIKRVIATGGQTVNIKNNKVYVDDVELDEPYTNGLPSKKLNSSTVTYPYTVPQGSVWVMGDNRTNSSDSRVFGAIPESSIIGHALAVYWPTSDAKILS